jgi:nitroimidazol reductase NimA-like FMN-containing flavoprotein (pyridoxamine 5'-phosphate oxidase superfamily)
MRRAELEIRDREMIKAILNICPIITVGLFDAKYPYTFPTNYGYRYEKNLVFYTQHAPEGHKLDLVARNPHVCVTAYAFADHIKNPRSLSNSRHDFRSVMAFGVMEEITPHTAEYREAWQTFLCCNGRSAAESFLTRDHSSYLKLFKITCSPEDVTGKSQDPLKSPADVPLPVEPADEEKQPRVMV